MLICGVDLYEEHRKAPEDLRKVRRSARMTIAFGDSSMVEQLTLDQQVGVRIPVPEPVPLVG